MGEHRVWSEQSRLHPGKQSRQRWLVVAAFCLLSLIPLWRIRQLPTQSSLLPGYNIATRVRPQPVFTWANIPTKPFLDYTPCFDHEFQCARLELPMDYFNGTTNATISLAVVRRPAAVPITDPRYGGAVLINPGGPGMSGITFLRLGGEYISHVIDSDPNSEDGKFFDLISFDPRGIPNSTPAVTCFENGAMADSWRVRIQEEGVFSSSDAAFGRIWAMAEAKSGACSTSKSDGNDIKRYVSTASVARDVLEIVERHGEWREKEARRLSGTKRGCWFRREEGAREVTEALKYQPAREKLQYWGFSYGTALGTTFAAMYPDRVHRLVLDGVVDMYDYTAMLWYDNLLDAEKAMDLFYVHCAQAGYPKCALAQPNTTTDTATAASTVKERCERILSKLHHNPIPVTDPPADVITYSDVRNVIFGALYTPIQAYPMLATILSSLEQGDGRQLASIIRPFHSFSCPSPSNPPSSYPPGPEPGMSRDAQMATSCSDGDSQANITRSEFAEHVARSVALSPTIGEMWSTIRLMCIHYRARAVHRFAGPWRGNTSHPVLFIGNEADPATPGRFAEKMAAGFEGARVVRQNSSGHCSVTAGSRCTEGVVRRYFQTGEVEEGDDKGRIFCDVDEVPFGDNGGENTTSGVRTTMERRKKIARALVHAGGGFMPEFGGRVRSAWFDD